MGIFSRARAALSRKPAKPAKRSFFKGAEMSRLFMDWIVGPTNIDTEVRSELLRLRNRGRDLKKNNATVKMYLALLSANVIGPKGFTLNANVRNKDKSLHTVQSEMLEEAWGDWRECASADGRMSLVQLEQLAIETWGAEGEVLIRIVHGDFNECGIALQIIDNDMLDEQYNVIAGPNQNEIRMGVEVDQWQRPVAYHLWDRDPYDALGGTARKRMRVPADQIIHLAHIERAGQTRGTSRLNPVMQSLKMLDGYLEAELVSSRTHASQMAFVRYTDASMASFDIDPDNAQGMQFGGEPGSITMLPPGTEIQEWNPQHAPTAFGPFLEAVLRQVAVGLGVSYTSLTCDLSNVNYSSIRSGMLIERDMYRTLQQMWINQFELRVYRAWVESAYLREVIKLGNLQDLKKYMKPTFIGRGFAWVDPLKDIQSSVLAIENSLTSRTAVLAELGGNIDDVMEQLAQEKDLAKQFGIDLEQVTKKPLAVSDATDKPDDQIEIDVPNDDAQKTTKGGSGGGGADNQ